MLTIARLDLGVGRCLIGLIGLLLVVLGFGTRHYSIAGKKYNKLKYMGLINRVYIPMDTSHYESI